MTPHARKTPNYSHLIGPVVSPFATQTPVRFEDLKPSLVAETRDELWASIVKLLQSNQTGDLVLSSHQVELLSGEHLRALEEAGVIAVRYSIRDALGAYGKNAAPLADELLQAINPEQVTPLNQDELLVLRNGFKGKFGLRTVTPKNMTPDQIRKAAFEKIPTTAQVISICAKNPQGQWEWGSSQVYPDGDHVIPPLTAAVHYAQSCFEGLAVMVNESGEVTLFRAEDNARRLSESCRALGIPAMDEQQIVASIEAAVMANRSFLPPAGSNAKLYVRPFMIGLGGATSAGIGLPDAYMFGVEAFPFGDYIGQRDSIVHTVVSDRERCVEGAGSVKGARNYVSTLGPKLQAKQDGFGEVIYFSQVVQTEGEDAPVIQDVLDEASAANVFFVSVQEDGVTLYTPALDRGTILPGITRATVMTLAQNLGYKVVEQALTREDIQNMDGAFFSGTAAGLVRVGSMTFNEGRKDFDQAQEGSDQATEVTRVFFNLYDHLYKARKGELEPNRFPQAARWAQKIGKVTV